MKSGSSDLTSLVSPSMISPSSPLNECSLRSPALSITAAAHRIRLDWILVSKSKEKVTNGVLNGSAFDRSSRLQDNTKAVG